MNSTHASKRSKLKTGGTLNITDEDIQNAITQENIKRDNRIKARNNGTILEYQDMSHWLKLDTSPIHNLGVFALKTIVENSLIVEYTGDFITETVADERQRQYEAEGITSNYLFGIKNIGVIDATQGGNISKYINHSCTPNAYAKAEYHDGKHKIFFYTKRPIYKGEEVTLDYNFDRDEAYPRIPCKCGSDYCQSFLDL